MYENIQLPRPFFVIRPVARDKRAENLALSATKLLHEHVMM